MQANYEKALRKLNTPEVSKLLLELHQYKARISRYLKHNSNSTELVRQASSCLLESTVASCRIDGVTIPNDRLKELVFKGELPNSRKEKEVLSYRFAFSTVSDGYSYIRISTGAFSQLHRDLYRYLENADFAGRWNNKKDIPFRAQSLRENSFRLASNFMITKQSVLRDACDNYKQAIASRICDPIVASLALSLDICNIQPYSEGNARLSRLIALLLLFQNGHFIGKYESLEAQIERTKARYLKAIESCPRVVSEDGMEEDAETDYLPYVIYMLEQLLECSKRFEEAYPLDQEPVFEDDEFINDEEEEPSSVGRWDVSREERLVLRAEMLARVKPLSASNAKADQKPAKQNAPEAEAKAEPAESPEDNNASKLKAAPAIEKPMSENEKAVYDFFQNLEGTAAKKDVVAACPNMSAKTVERMIQKFLAEGYIEKIGAARATAYQRAK